MEATAAVKTTATVEAAAMTTAATATATPREPGSSARRRRIFTDGAVPGLASDSASARCCEATASTNMAAAARPRRRTRPASGI